MKITIELEVGEVTGAVAGILNSGINDFKQNLGVIRPENVDMVIRAIRHAEAVRDEIQNKVEAISAGH